MTLTISQLNTQLLFEHEKLFSSITPETINNTLTAALLYKKGTSKTSIVMKDSLSIIILDLEGDVQVDTPEDLAIFFEFSKLMYILRNYDAETLKTLKIMISINKEKETSSFNITCAKDRLSLPHMIMTEAQQDDFFSLETQVPEDTSKFLHWTDLSDSARRDFSQGLMNSALFLDTDEKKNNAIALYSNRIVSNDPTQVFVYNLNEKLIIDNWIPLHKRIVKIMVTLLLSGNLTEAFINKDLVYFSTSKAFCKLNNAVSNIAPPDEADLERISSKELLTKTSIELIKNTSNFFSGFYTSSSAINPIKLDFFKDKILCILQDSGLAEFSSCNIEREIPVDT